MNKKYKNEFIVPVIALFVVFNFFLLTAGHLVQRREISIMRKDSNKALAQVESDLGETRAVVTALTDGNATLAQTLEEERGRRTEAEENFLLSQKTIASVQADVANQRQTLEASDITNLIKQWSPRVVKVECSVELSDDVFQKTKASGVATIIGTVTQVYTSKHVVEEKTKLAESCRIRTMDEANSFVSNSISIDEKSDLAYLKFIKIIALPNAITPVKKCESRPTIGDQVVILGYPSVGAEDGITATDGIISGFDKNYYITSAKIERGNSGGAAIHVKNNCLLGLPTLVVAGQIESLARILAL